MVGKGALLRSAPRNQPTKGFLVKKENLSGL
jgi:hypothetical protein